MILRRSRAWALLAAGVLLIAAGCTDDQVQRPGQPSGSSTGLAASSPAAPTDADPELAQRKADAGIADCPSSDPAATPLEQNGLPDVELACLGGGEPVRLAGLRGKPMIVNVWAQWCEPCRTEAPFLSEVAQQDNQDLVILGIDYNDPRPELAIDFAAEANWPYPQLQDQDKVIQDPLKVLGPPQTFFVTADGTIAYRHSGPFTSADQICDLAAEHLKVHL